MANSPPKVVPVKDAKQIEEFIKFPFQLYKEDPYWVPPLLKERRDFFNPNKNPFFDEAKVQLFLAKQENKVLGRIAAIVNYNYIKFHQEEAGFFGFFETNPNYEIAKALFDAVRDWLKEEGMESIQGPVNFSTNHECGLLVEGFNFSPAIMMPYNPKYYSDYLERYGFTKAKDLLAYILDFNNPSAKRQNLAKKVRKKRKITIRSINLRNFKNEVEKIKKIYNNAWQKNWGFVPMTDREFWWMAENLKKVVVPELCLLAEVEGETVGFSLNLPDINQALKKVKGRLFPWGILKLFYYSRKIKLLRGLTFGIIEKYRKLGIDLLLQEEIRKTALQMGYLREEISWVLEDNKLVNRTLTRAGARVYKKYRIYKMEI